MGWTFPYGEEERQLFLQETAEQLEALEAALLALERGEAAAEAVAQAFRAAHTVKGAAGTVGHRPLAELTHALEGVLDALRAGRVAYAPALGDALLGALDRLQALHRAVVEGGGGDEDVGEEVARLQALVDGGAGASAPLAAPPAAALRVRIRWAPGTAMPAVRAYQALLAAEGLGEVVASRPSRAEVEREEAGDTLELTWRGEQPEALLGALRALPEAEAVEVLGEAAPGRDGAAGPALQGSVRIDVAVLDRLMNLVGELVVGRTRLARLAALGGAGEEAARELADLAAHLGRVTAELQGEVMRARLLPVEVLFRRFPRLVRDAARQTRKEVALRVEGQDTELDRSVLEAIGEPLVHLLRNAVDHGIEPPEVRRALGKPPQGEVLLTAAHRDNEVVVTVADDGAGMDPEAIRRAAVARGVLGEEAARRLGDEEALQLVFAPGFSTRGEVTELSGRGVGLDVVRRRVEALGGAVSVRTERGRGTAFTLRLPLTLAILPALLVRVGETPLALPLAAVVEVGERAGMAPATVGGREVVRLRGAVVPVVDGRRLLAEDPGGDPGRYLVHLQLGAQAVALAVDELLGQEDVVLKALEHRLARAPGWSGAALLADGRVALVADPATLVAGAAAVA